MFSLVEQRMKREREVGRKKMTVFSVLGDYWMMVSLMKIGNRCRLGLWCPWNIPMVLSKRQVEICFRSFRQNVLATGIYWESRSTVYWEFILFRKTVELDRYNIWGD